MRSAILRGLSIAFIFIVSACGGGGGGGGASPTGPVPIATASPTPAPPAVSSASAAVTTAGPTTVSFAAVAGGLTGNLVFPAANGAATVALTFSASAPASAPAVQSSRRVVRNIGATVTPIAYFTAQSSTTVTFGSSLGSAVTTPGTVTGSEYLVLFDSSTPSAGWNPIAGPGTSAGVAAGAHTAPLTFQQGVVYDIALVSTQAALAVPTPVPTPTLVPTPAPVVVSVSALQLVGVGAAYASTFTVSQAGYSGNFTLGGTSCGGITVTNTATSPSAFTITPVGVGTCSYTITGNGAQAMLPVSVTSVSVGGQ